MYECMDWMVHVPDPDYRKALLIYCRDKAHGWRFSRTCKKMGWNRRTAYNRKDKAAQQVASNLSQRGILCAEQDIDAVAQIQANHVRNTGTMGNRAHPPTAWIAEGAKPRLIIPEPTE